MLLAALTAASLAAPTGLDVQFCWGRDEVVAACPTLRIALADDGVATGVELLQPAGDVVRSLPGEGEGAWSMTRGGRRLRIVWDDGPTYEGERVGGACFAGRVRGDTASGVFVACPTGLDAAVRVADGR